MVVTKLVHKKKTYLLVFITLGRQDTNEISGWINKKISSGDVEGNNLKEKIDDLFYMCEQKFGERPFIVEDKMIPIVKIR